MLSTTRKMCGVVHRYLGKGARCALPLHPSGYGSSMVSNPLQSQQTVSPVKHSRETSLSLHPSIPSGRSGAIAPLETHSQDLETCLSTCTEPCTNDWPFDHQSGEPSSSHRYPHEDFIQTTSWRPTLRRLDAVNNASACGLRLRCLRIPLH